jgi:hypothetical protein
MIRSLKIIDERNWEETKMAILLGFFTTVTIIIAFVMLLNKKTSLTKVVMVMAAYAIVNIGAYVVTIF